jgi:hypothetical protein
MSAERKVDLIFGTIKWLFYAAVLVAFIADPARTVIYGALTAALYVLFKQYQWALEDRQKRERQERLEEEQRAAFEAMSPEDQRASAELYRELGRK